MSTVCWAFCRFTCATWVGSRQLPTATLASFHAASMLFAIPIALLSDRIGSRRGVLIMAMLLIGSGTGLLGIAGGGLISLAVLLAGITRDGFMATSMTAIIETEGVGRRFAGSAAGLAMSAMGVSNVLAPPIGNWLAQFGAGLPFLFWAALVFSGILVYLFLRQPATGRADSAQAGR